MAEQTSMPNKEISYKPKDHQLHFKPKEVRRTLAVRLTRSGQALNPHLMLLKPPISNLIRVINPLDIESALYKVLHVLVIARSINLPLQSNG